MQSITDDFAKNAAKLAETVKGNIAVTVPSDKKGEFIYHLIENGGYPASKKAGRDHFQSFQKHRKLNIGSFCLPRNYTGKTQIYHLRFFG